MVDESVFPGDPVCFAVAPGNVHGPGVGVGASSGSANGGVGFGDFGSGDKGPVAPQGPQVKEEVELEEERGEQESPSVQ